MSLLKTSILIISDPSTFVWQMKQKKEWSATRTSDFISIIFLHLPMTPSFLYSPFLALLHAKTGRRKATCQQSLADKAKYMKICLLFTIVLQCISKHLMIKLFENMPVFCLFVCSSKLSKPSVCQLLNEIIKMSEKETFLFFLLRVDSKVEVST